MPTALDLAEAPPVPPRRNSISRRAASRVRTMVNHHSGCGLDPAPIALFVHRRPDHTRRTLEHLAANRLAAESQLFVFSDGPRGADDAAAVEAVRCVVRGESRFRRVTVHERPHNLGLRDSVIGGVTALVSEFGRAIVLEDDLLTAPCFLEFMNEALRRYAERPEIMQVAGHLATGVSLHPDRASLLPLPSSWGWATWKRAWDHFDPLAIGSHRLDRDVALRQAFDLDGAVDYSGMLRDSLANRNASWAVRWYLSVFLRGGLTVYPGRSLVRNIGFDGSGVHCHATPGPSEAPLEDASFTFPAETTVDPEQWVQVKRAVGGAARTTQPPAAATRTGSRGTRRPFRLRAAFPGRPLAALRDRLATAVHDLGQRGARLAAARDFRRQTSLAADAQVFPEAGVRNLRGDPTRIRVGRNTAVRGELLVFAHAGEIVVGEDCYIGDGARIWSSDRVVIGNRVLISHGVNIHDTNSHPLDCEERHRHFLQILRSGHPRQGVAIAAAPIVIEDDAWIGFQATVLKGVRIGRGAIVGAGAVVVADVPSFAVVVGNPARVVRNHVAQSRAA